jgi:hypothetical protein
MLSKHCSGIIGITTLLFTFGSQPVRAQNVYPASGDALIHGLTIGTGRGGAISNTALGDSALFSNNKGVSNNTAVGRQALFHNVTGNDNTAMGYQALYTNVSGAYNLAAGSGALYSNQSGSYNVALGEMALYNNTNVANTAAGMYALYSSSAGLYNTACGLSSLYNTAKGYYNSAFGLAALATNTTGVCNTALGAWADVAYSNLYNTTAIGYGAVATANNSVVVGNAGVTSIGGFLSWTNFSDGRYKKNITRNVPGLAFIDKLNPVAYTLDVDGIEARLHPHNTTIKGPDGQLLPDPMANPAMQQAMQEKSRIVYTGFIAQEVEKAAQSLGYDFSGIDKPKDDQQSFYGLRYSDFVVPLVKAVQELGAMDDSLKAADTLLSSRLDRIEQLLGIDPTNRNPSMLSLSSARLFQNAPNPFNQGTLIRFYIPPNAGACSLQITGIQGEIIKTIALRGYGYGQVTIQNDQLASGAYTYSLFVDGKLIDTKKMVLLK